MSLFEQFPYTNLHELNLDWMVKIVKDFLDQYTHIQELIADGEQALTDKTAEGLNQLQEKAETLEGLLQQWYNTHSQDIANQLAAALADLNAWYTTHQGYLDQYVLDSIGEFNTAANQKTLESIASIPDDYTTLSNKVTNNTNNINTIGLSNNEKSFIPAFSIISGKEILVDGLSIVNHASYNITSLIPVYPLQVLEISYQAASTALATVVLADSTGTPTALIAKGNAAGNAYKTRYFNNSNTIKYVIASSVNTYTIAATIYNNVLMSGYSYKDFIYLPQFWRASDNTMTNWANMYIDNTPVNNYLMTTPIKVNLGETIVLYGRTSSSIPALIKTNSTGSTYTEIIAGTGNLSTYRYTAVDNDTYVICQYLFTDGCVISISATDKVEDDIVDNRHGVVTFIFDDGNTQDFDIADIFKTYNLRCGFALISTIITDMSKSKKYLELQDDGFEILSHSTDADPMNDPTIPREDIASKMARSKTLLTEKGYNIKGWVTPSSVLADTFKPITEMIYNYAYTNYYGTYDPETATVRPYNDFSDATNELYRVDMYSNTDDLKSAIDATIANKGLLTIYFHWTNVGQVYIDRLEDLLEYIISKGFNVKCLPPNQAIKYYYNVRKTDL